MSSNEAQKSTVHHATEDSATAPTNATAAPDVGEARSKLHPDPGEAAGAAPAGPSPGDETAIPNDPDESSYGGPLKIDDPDAR